MRPDGTCRYRIEAVVFIAIRGGSGKLRAIGHSLPKPTALLPKIPPIAETVSGFDYLAVQQSMAQNAKVVAAVGLRGSQ